MPDTNQSGSHPEDAKIHSGMRSFVTTDAEFRAAVQSGIASAKRGPNRNLEDVATEIRQALLRD